MKLRRRGVEVRVVRMGIGSFREVERLVRVWVVEEEDGRWRREGRLRLEMV